MTRSGPTDPDALPLELARLVDARCDRFESAWAAGCRPSIEDELAEVAEAACPALLRELVALEVSLRRAAGEAPELDEYRRRFPDAGECVASAFGRARDSSGPRTSTATDRGGGEGPSERGPGPPGTLPRYRILRHHASGGLGQVSVALDRELNREVALKEIQLHRADDPASRTRFLLEAEVTGVLEHPGVVPIYSLGRYDNGRPYYAMRLIRGESFKEAIRRSREDTGSDRRSRELGLRLLLRRFLDLCNTVAYAHSRGVLHRDIKPANVMLGPYGETLLVDWGLAKVVGRDDAEVPLAPHPALGAAVETQPDSALGTPGYMSPEQGAGHAGLVGPASDIYSLGATLYHILTGRPPAGPGGPSSPGAPSVAPRKLDPAIPPALEAICLKALAPRPEDRYASAARLADDVERWLADEPVFARREPLGERARRWLKRHRTLATSATAAMVVGATALAVLAARERASNVQIRRERDRADARFGAAAEAIEAFQTAVATTVDVRDRPDLRPIRQALLAQPYRYFRRLRDDLESDPDPRPDHQERLARAYQSLAELTREVDTLENALVAYRGALAVRERLALLRPGDARARNALAGAHLNVANVLSALRRPDEARASFERALEMRRTLAAQHPDDPAILDGLARASNNYANLLDDLGRYDESLRAHDDAVRVRLRLTRERPGDPRAWAELANSHYNIGNLLSDMCTRAGGGPEARELADRSRRSYEDALAIQERLAREHPEGVGYRFELGRTYNNLGFLHLGLERWDDARDAFARALEVKERLARERPTAPVYQADLARTCDNLGIVLRETGRPTEAAARFAQALRLRRALTEQHPGVDAYQADLAASLTAVADLHRRAGEPEEALPLDRRAVEIRTALLEKAPDLVRYRRGLGEASGLLGATLRALGRPAEAAAVARERARLLSQDPIELYNAACDLSLCIPLATPEPGGAESSEATDRQRYAGEAVALLRAAVALGFDQPDQIEVLKGDEALRPLWTDQRFRELAAELLDPGDPFLHDLALPADPFAP